MKRYGNLYTQIITKNNLYEADRKAQLGKKKRKSVIIHNEEQHGNIERLHEILVSKTFVTSQYSVFTIFEPKERLIAALPYFPDRILHHAIINILEPIFTNSFIEQTYSCIKKRGVLKCVKQLETYLKKKDTKYCLKLDIKKYYASINKAILKQKLSNKFKDKNLLKLLFEIIDSNKIGIVLGSLLSQWFANFYLNEFDHWLKQDKKVKYYLKYMDDVVILSDSKKYLHKLRQEIQIFLETLGLSLSNYQVFGVEERGIDFAGYVSFHKYRKLRKSIKQRWKKMLRKRPNYKSIISYNGWLTHCNSKNLINKYLK